MFTLIDYEVRKERGDGRWRADVFDCNLSSVRFCWTRLVWKDGRSAKFKLTTYTWYLHSFFPFRFVFAGDEMKLHVLQMVISLDYSSNMVRYSYMFHELIESFCWSTFVYERHVSSKRRILVLHVDWNWFSWSNHHRQGRRQGVGGSKTVESWWLVRTFLLSYITQGTLIRFICVSIWL